LIPEQLGPRLQKSDFQGKGGGGEYHLTFMGSALLEVFAAGTFLLGMGGDNDTNFQLMCNVMVGANRKLKTKE
jgi:hypothetical protein